MPCSLLSVPYALRASTPDMLLAFYLLTDCLCQLSTHQFCDTKSLEFNVKLTGTKGSPQLSGCLSNDGMNVCSEAESSGPPFTVASCPEVPEVFLPK